VEVSCQALQTKGNRGVMKIIICDRCGKPAKEKNTSIDNIFASYDLCKECKEYIEEKHEKIILKYESSISQLRVETTKHKNIKS